MWLDLAMLLGGGTLLYFGAEWLVAGAAGLARSFGVSALLVGLTVVAYGTSAPEIVVGVEAASGGHGEVALGNVLGSNVANIGLILGIASLIKPTRINRDLRQREVPMLVLTALVTPLCLADGVVWRWEGAFLVLGAALYTGWMIRSARADSILHAVAAAEVTAEAADAAGAPEPGISRWRLSGLALAGLAALVVGGDLFVEGAVQGALMLGISERVVGLTIVAIGTSLPELATSVIAAYRGHSDIAVGNVVGSNIFNVLLCLGCASLAGDIRASLHDIALDLGMMIGLTVAAAFMMRTERTLTRAEAGVLVGAYVGFLLIVTLF